MTPDLDGPAHIDLNALPFFQTSGTSPTPRTGVRIPAFAAAHLARTEPPGQEQDWDEELLAGARNSPPARTRGGHEGTEFWRTVAQLRAQVAETQARELDGRAELTPQDKEMLGQKNIHAAVAEYVSHQLALGGQRAVWDEDHQGAVRQAIFDQMFRLGRFQPMIDDPQIENIHVNGFDQVYVEYIGGRKEKTAPVAESDQELMEDIQFLATRNGEESRPFSQAQPDLDMDLLGYVRLAAVAPPVSQRPSAVFRIHRYLNITLDEMVAKRTLTAQAAAFLKAAVKAKKSIVVSGFGGDGKTTLLRALADQIDPNDQIVTIEMERELHLERLSSRTLPPISLQYRPGTGERDSSGAAAGEYTLEKAMQKALRLNSQRIIVGEVRGNEIVAMVRAMQTGAGTFSTTHAYDPDDCIDGLAGLGRDAYGEDYMARQLGRHLDLVIQLAKIEQPDGAAVRKVTHIAEVMPAEGDRLVATQNLFHLDVAEGDTDARFLRLPSSERLRNDLLRAGLDEALLSGARA